MANATPDFVQVQLTAAGIAFAGAGQTLRVCNGHFDYTFTPGNPVKVLISEWSRVLSAQLSNGQPVFELVSTGAQAAQQSGASVTISPEASHSDAPAQPAPQPAFKTKSTAAKSAAATEVK
jgi:hypothetical protein